MTNHHTLLLKTTGTLIFSVTNYTYFSFKYKMASTICSLIGEVTITSINGDYNREVMVTSKNATICSLILVTLILVTSKK